MEIFNEYSKCEYSKVCIFAYSCWHFITQRWKKKDAKLNYYTFPIDVVLGKRI